VPAHEDAAAEPGHQGPHRVRIHLMEIDHGGFCREVELPEDVDKDRIAANYRNGMLWIELPKTAVREAAEAQAEM
jgi:HSP20 family molecular chaperone IbpA